MLCFVRQMSLTIFHLCDLDIGIVGMLPFLVGTLLRFRSNFASSSRVGVSMPLAFASFVRNSV